MTIQTLSLYSHQAHYPYSGTRILQDGTAIDVSVVDPINLGLGKIMG